MKMYLISDNIDTYTCLLYTSSPITITRLSGNASSTNLFVIYPVFPTSRVLMYCLPLQILCFIIFKNKKHRPRSSCVYKNSVLSAPSGVRTLDTLIKSQVLYQLS